MKDECTRTTKVRYRGSQTKDLLIGIGRLSFLCDAFGRVRQQIGTNIPTKPLRQPTCLIVIQAKTNWRSNLDDKSTEQGLGIYHVTSNLFPRIFFQNTSAHRSSREAFYYGKTTLPPSSKQSALIINDSICNRTINEGIEFPLLSTKYIPMVLLTAGTQCSTQSGHR